MKFKSLIAMSLTLAGLASCTENNPLLKEYNTYRQLPPFEQVKTEHFMPAFKEAIRIHNAEIEAICQNPEAPTFENTVVAFEAAGTLLNQVEAMFGTLAANETNDDLMALEEELTPILSEHGTSISLNETLYQRFKAVYDQRESLGLNREQLRLLEDYQRFFVDNGATLEGEDRETYRQLSQRLSLLTMSFAQNALKSTNAYSKHITDSTLLSGLPESQLAAAAEKAAAKGLEGWVFDLSMPSYQGVMKYADSRELRREILLAYNSRALDGEFDNRENIRQIVNTRLELAQLFGYPDYASFSLKRKMAKNSANVYGMLNQLKAAYLKPSQKEYEDLCAFTKRYEGKDTYVEMCDWSYYSNKMQESLFDLNDEILRPYFELSRVKDGVFGLANRLYGLRFEANPDIEVWHKDVQAYEVFDRDGSLLAVLYTDFFPRSGKKSGAWMNIYRAQHRLNGEREFPIVTLTMNFTPPTADKPSLLTFYELTTFLHEFGHGLHGMLSDVTYPSMASPNVAWDFVELPSQIMENWADKQEWLDGFAAHYQTGEKIPMELIQKIKDAANFHVAYACCRQLGFGYLDMAFHTLQEPFTGDVAAFEAEAFRETSGRLGLPEGYCMSTAFGHIFSGGYAAGYYSYKWAEILAFDAFDHYTERDVFDSERADAFRHLLSKGNAEDAAELYREFRGQDAGIDAMLRHNGLK